MKGMYRHIYLVDGVYRIRKDNDDFLMFDDLYDALLHRDLLEDCDWDWDCYINMEIPDNPYLGRELPEFTHNSLRYIYYSPNEKKPYSIRKWIGDKYCRFGRYKRLDKAIEVRDDLIANDWCSLGELKRKKREKQWK